MDGGLKKIDDAESLVDVLKIELAEKMPMLIKTQKEVDDMMIVIAKDKEAAQEVELMASNAEALIRTRIRTRIRTHIRTRI